MANEIRGDIVVRGADKASRDLKDVGKSAATAGAQIEDLGVDAKAAAKGVDGLGEQAKDSTTQITDLGDGVGFLDSEVVRLEAHLKSLKTQLNETGDTSLIRQIRKGQRDLNMFSKLAKDVAPGASSAGVKVGMSFAEGIIEAATSASKSGGPILIGALAAAAVAAVPFIGASVGAAVLGGVGGGGIVGGITLAAKDPRVKAAAEDVGKAMASSLEPIGKSFVEPVIGSLDIFKRAVADIGAQAAPGMAELAKEVEPLALAFANLGKNAMPGFLKALDAAKPILRVLAAELPEVGDALSDMFESFAEGGDGAVMAFSVLMDIVKDSLVLFGDFVSVAGQTYEGMVALGIAFGDAADKAPELVHTFMPLLRLFTGLDDLLEDQANALDKSSVAGEGTANAMRNLKKETAEAAAETQNLIDAVSNYLDLQMSLDQAQLRWAQGLIDVKKELNEGKKTLDEFSVEGGKNVGVLQAQIDKANDMREATIRQGDGTKEAMDKANEAYRSNVQQLYNMAVAAGFNKKALDEMFAPYLNGPREAITEFKFPGLIDGLNKAYALRNVLGSLAAVNNANAGTYVSGRASGGPVEAGRPYIVGEQGPELIIPGQSGTVMTAAQTKAMQSGASGGSAMPTGGGISATIGVAGGMEPAMTALVVAMLPYLTLEVGRQGGSISRITDSRI